MDNRFKAAVPVYGCGFYDESDVFKKDLEKLTEADRVKWLKYFDPSVYLLKAEAEFLFVNGNKDRFYNVIPYHKTYSLISEKSRQVCIKPDMSDSHPAGWEPLEIRTFFDHFAFGLAAAPTVQQVKIKDGLLSASYTSPVSLVSAHFFIPTIHFHPMRNESGNR
ncbi:hypothetical protein [Dyadobacter tibetensis]|uniref:hypothetical protein n=1 Tax=Dyadobacter tibetensis TaxID=1211851 RepID=UPI001039C372|nr:hypothetical protein [Dyadobacter tibetensis]